MERLSECEEKILMAVYGSAQPPRMKDVFVDANYKYGREWMPQTVSKFLSRLVGKGYLDAVRKGRCTYYYPLVSLEEYQKMRLRQMKDGLFGGDTALLERNLREI